ncbi:hypothetical protein D3C71_1552680 [compost metagenome]
MQTGGIIGSRHQIDAAGGVLIQLVLLFQRRGLIGQDGEFLIQFNHLVTQLRHFASLCASGQQNQCAEQANFGVTGCHGGYFLFNIS